MELDILVEAILFSSDEPVTPEQLSAGLGVSLDEVEQAVSALDTIYSARGIYIQRVAGGLRIATRPEVGKIISRAFERRIQVPLSRGALETLAVIAYCQPVTRQDIQAIRGVNPEASIDTLMEKGLIEEVGRKKTLGRPKLYGTTDEFLKKTSLDSIDDLPPLKPD
ncbi:MAG: SMC-Scp complex subunit ScpB [Firmicutes bacterium]|nr:SMC-Scp complex subunit ScpB [Candidatus Fermentithermobacillaceae bacterium]HOV66026.1 SMC-Scp complex subunit ScpB [Bacillota bacterium]